MPRRPITDPVPLAGKKKRLRSLNEFEAPYWLGLFQPRAKGEASLWPVILVGIAIGAVIGWFVLPEF